MADDDTEDRSSIIKDLARQAARTLEGKTCTRVVVGGDSLRIEFNDGSTVFTAASSGVGADSEWYTWTVIRVNGFDLVNE
jgi:hypothetical protein